MSTFDELAGIMENKDNEKFGQVLVVIVVLCGLVLAVYSIHVTRNNVLLENDFFVEKNNFEQQVTSIKQAYEKKIADYKYDLGVAESDKSKLGAEIKKITADANKLAVSLRSCYLAFIKVKYPDVYNAEFKGKPDMMEDVCVAFALQNYDLTDKYLAVESK